MEIEDIGGDQHQRSTGLLTPLLQIVPAVCRMEHRAGSFSLPSCLDKNLLSGYWGLLTGGEVIVMTYHVQISVNKQSLNTFPAIVKHWNLPGNCQPPHIVP